MALDAGAHGVIVPYVETVEEVKSLVGAVKYRPFDEPFELVAVSLFEQPRTA